MSSKMYVGAIKNKVQVRRAIKVAVKVWNLPMALVAKVRGIRTKINRMNEGDF